jgi:hypothetical protein
LAAAHHVLLLRVGHLNKVLQVDVDPTDVIGEPFIKDIDKTPGIFAIKTRFPVVLFELCDDCYEPAMRVLVLLGDGAAIPLHAVFLEREMPASVLMQGLEEDAVNGPAFPFIKGGPKILRHLEQHPVLVIDSLNAGCECIGPLHRHSVGPSVLRDRACGRCSGRSTDGRGGARHSDQCEGGSDDGGSIEHRNPADSGFERACCNERKHEAERDAHRKQSHGPSCNVPGELAWRRSKCGPDGEFTPAVADLRIERGMNAVQR